MLSNITKTYGIKTVVKDFSLEVQRGEICVLIGPSGCGKTTTLRMINRMVEPTSGNIFINGTDIKKIRPDLLRRSMGYAIQMVGLFPHMNVFSNIAAVPQLLAWKKDRIKERVEELMILVGLKPQEYINKYPHQLSGGEAQRIGVARALAADPEILLMDEPFGAVDPLNRAKLQTQFLNIQKRLKKTIILVTHDLDEAIRLADKIAIMKDGLLLQYDSPEQILSKPADKFVHDFVGSDRALKRLSRINVDKFITEAPYVKVGAQKDFAQKKCGVCRWLWVVDDNNKLTGWIDAEILLKSPSVTEAVCRINASDISVTKDSSLKEALSVMLNQGLKTVPVVDNDGFLLGEVDMSGIEKVLSEKGGQ